MKNIFFIFVSIWFFSSSFGAEKHVVEAKIKNLKDSEIMVYAFDITGNRELFDTIINCKNGRFTFDREFEVPSYILFVPKSGLFDTKTIRGVVKRETMSIELYMLAGEKYKIDGNLVGNQLLYDISGSEINSVMSKLRSKYKDANRYADMENEYFSDNRSKADRDSIYFIGKRIEAEMLVDKLEYLKNNLNSQLSGLFLSELGYADFDKYYLLVDESVKNGVFKNLIVSKKKRSDLVKNNVKMVAGSDIIDFTLVGLDGKTVTLSSFKGKYVLLYFWGSWCHWCIKGAPGLNKFYEEYKDKVEIIGIACNDREPALKKVIKDNNIQWNNFLETNDLSFQYGITGFPTKILIDPNGKVIFKYEGEHEDFYKEMFPYIK